MTRELTRGEGAQMTDAEFKRWLREQKKPKRARRTGDQQIAIKIEITHEAMHVPRISKAVAALMRELGRAP